MTSLLCCTRYVHTDTQKWKGPPTTPDVRVSCLRSQKNSPTLPVPGTVHTYGTLVLGWEVGTSEYPGMKLPRPTGFTDVSSKSAVRTLQQNYLPESNSTAPFSEYHLAYRLNFFLVPGRSPYSHDIPRT
jgi:hypothetical protein